MKPKLYLINGPLGAGKTTFLKKLIGSDTFSNARIIENEFASTSIDTDQLHDHQAEVKTIAGVCICCSTGDELTEALRNLATSNEPVIIEATGVANSLKLVEKIVVADMLELYDLTHAVFILDGAEIASDLNAVSTLYRQELHAADTVLISKLDLLDDYQTQAIYDELSRLSLRQVGRVIEGQFDMSLLEAPSQILHYFAQVDDDIVNRDGGANYTVVQTANMRIDSEDMIRIWNNLSSTYGLGRMKGQVRDSRGAVWHIEATPSQCRVTESSDERFELVLIGERAYDVYPSTIQEMINTQ